MGIGVRMIRIGLASAELNNFLFFGIDSGGLKNSMP